MHQRVTRATEGDQVLLRIIATLAAKILVVHLLIGPAATALAPPAVTLQHLLPESIVQLGIKSLAWAFG